MGRRGDREKIKNEGEMAGRGETGMRRIEK
jgi:hypothetical protein